jgi:hypothetical protein
VISKQLLKEKRANSACFVILCKRDRDKAREIHRFPRGWYHNSSAYCSVLEVSTEDLWIAWWRSVLSLRYQRYFYRPSPGRVTAIIMFLTNYYSKVLCPVLTRNLNGAATNQEQTEERFSKNDVNIPTLQNTTNRTRNLIKTSHVNLHVTNYSTTLSLTYTGYPDICLIILSRILTFFEPVISYINFKYCSHFSITVPVNPVINLQSSLSSSRSK